MIGKVVGLLFVVLCCGGIGFYAAERLRQQMEYCIRIRQLFREFGIRMRWNADTTAELVERCAEQQAFQGLHFLQNTAEQLRTGKMFPEAWESGVRSDKQLPAALCDLLLELGECMGTSDLEGQLVTLEQYRERMEPFCTAAAERFQRTGKLYRSMGILGGVSVALLLC